MRLPRETMAILKSIGRYEIKGRIGGGGMGTLYLAHDTNPKTARLVAVKLLKANLDSDDLRRRFELEALFERSWRRLLCWCMHQLLFQKT